MRLFSDTACLIFQPVLMITFLAVEKVPAHQKPDFLSQTCLNLTLLIG